MKNVVFPEGIGFNCKKCGRCCREQPGDTTPEEQRLIEEKGFSNFLDKADGTGLRFIKRKADGSCFFLKKDNTCLIYEIRPAICRIVPFFLTDFDHVKNIIEVNLITGTRCEGVHGGKNSSAEEMGKAGQEIVSWMIERMAKYQELPATDERVLSAIRILIMGHRVRFGISCLS